MHSSGYSSTKVGNLLLLKMANFSLFSLALLFVLAHHLTIPTAAQSPAEAPAPPPPTNVSKILEKAGQFTILLRLLKSTQVGDQINTQLNASNQGLTILAPTDNAFSNLKSGTLNSLTDEEKVELLQFHLLPTFLTLSNFQTVSNPVRTQAGDYYEFPLNITTSGNLVNVSTGLVNTSLSGTIYTDDQLAIYQVDSVLKPLGLFNPRPPPPAPAPEKTKKKAKDSAATPKVNVNSGGVSLSGSVNGVVYSGISAIIAGIIL